MGLIKTLFNRTGSDSQGRDDPSSDETDSELSEASEGRTQRRRELIHGVVRDTMRTHGVPGDWLTAMVLPLSGAKGRRGVHAVLVVHQGHEQMLAYVPAFQRSFFAALREHEARPTDWMMGLSWQFDGLADPVGATALPPLRTPAVAPAGEAAAAAGAHAGQAGVLAQEEAGDEDLQADLRALFAIRDQALQPPDSAPPESDFQPTQPLE